MSEVITAAATVAAAVTSGGTSLIFTAIAVASSAYGADQAKKKAAQRQAEQQAAQRAAYNASLKDRLITNVSADMPDVHVYGRAKVGCNVVAMFTSGGSDQYRHLVCVHASHEIDAYEDVYINGTALGALDADGIPTNSAMKYYGSVRVKKHLGTPADPADAALMAECPGKWFSTSVLRGYAYTYIRLDLNEREFQSGLPNIQVRMRGKKLYDPRSGLTVWSRNNALAILDYLTGPMCGVDLADLPMSQFITAANVCDEAGVRVSPRYTFNGVIYGDADQQRTLEQMAQSMAGGIVPITWDIWAGKYVAPVMHFDLDDRSVPSLVGDISLIPGVSAADLYNGVRGQYVSADALYVSTDFKPYQNAAYVSADGKELWTNIDFPFTDELQRVHNLCRIFTEDQRNSYALTGQFALKAWALKVGQRITISSGFFGWSSKVFRVTGKKYQNGQPVTLSLKEDAASIWDEADAVAVDSTQNSGLPDPFAKPAAPTGLALVSGTSELSVAGDGTVISRIKVAWNFPANVYVESGHAELQCKLSADTGWTPGPVVNGGAGPAWIAPVKDGAAYDVRVRFYTPFGGFSDWATFTGYSVVGKTQPPADVTGFSVVQNGEAVIFTWYPVADVDLAGYEIRYIETGGLWSSATPITRITRGTQITNAAVPPGVWDFHIRARDTSGNYSVNSDVYSMTVKNTFNLIYSEQEAPAWNGTLTHLLISRSGMLVPMSQGVAADDGWDTFDKMVPNPYPTCSYEHNTIDMGFDAENRIWADIVSSIPPASSGVAAPALHVDYRLGAGSFAGFQPWTIGAVKARYVKHKLVIDTAQGIPVIGGFTPIVDAAEFQQSFTSIVAAGGSSVTFPKRYNVAPTVGATAQGATALYAVVDNTTITQTGCTAHVFNAAGADVGGMVRFDTTGA